MTATAAPHASHLMLLSADGGVLLQGEGLLLNEAAAATPTAGMAAHAGLRHSLGAASSHLLELL